MTFWPYPTSSGIYLSVYLSVSWSNLRSDPAPLSCRLQCHTHPGWSICQSRSGHPKPVPTLVTVKVTKASMQTNNSKILTCRDSATGGSSPQNEIPLYYIVPRLFPIIVLLLPLPPKLVSKLLISWELGKPLKWIMALVKTVLFLWKVLFFNPNCYVLCGTCLLTSLLGFFLYVWRMM